MRLKRIAWLVFAFSLLIALPWLGCMAVDWLIQPISPAHESDELLEERRGRLPMEVGSKP